MEQELQGEDKVGLGVIRANQKLRLLGLHAGLKVLDWLGYLTFDFHGDAPASQVVDFGLQVEIGQVEEIAFDLEVV